VKRSEIKMGKMCVKSDVRRSKEWWECVKDSKEIEKWKKWCKHVCNCLWVKCVEYW
jgi:hypothetical protein